MDFNDTPEEAAFRTEVRAFLDKNAVRKSATSTAYRTGHVDADFLKTAKAWQAKKAEAGYAAITWPVRYGGRDGTPIQQVIYGQEEQNYVVPHGVFHLGLSIALPTMMMYATPEQNERYIKPALRGDEIWCQLFSEPSGGSDLAGLQTRAEDMGDYFLVNGQKVWTSYADKADWIFCLVRTDFTAAKHQGISFVLFDMQSPGVSTRPIRLISGASPFCETFFDNVRVPKAQLVGELNRGWDIAKYLLTHEREMISRLFGVTGAGQVAPADIAVRRIGLEHGKLAEPGLRGDIARLEMDAAAFGLTLERLRDEARAGVGTGAASSMLKYYGTELNKRRQELLVSIHGSDALGWEGAAFDDGLVARSWLRSKGNSIEGGTSEVQLNVIAKRILGLPG